MNKEKFNSLKDMDITNIKDKLTSQLELLLEFFDIFTIEVVS